MSGRYVPRWVGCGVGTFFVLAGAVMDGRADVRYWDGGSGNYTSPARWSFGPLPNPDDTVVFQAPTTYTVIFASNTMQNDMIVRDGDVTFDISFGGDPRTLTLMHVSQAPTATDPSLAIGTFPGQSAALHIRGGMLAAPDVVLGRGATGHLSISGPNAELEVFNRLIIGDLGGHGSMYADNGATLSTQRVFIGWLIGSSEGLAEIRGSGTTWNTNEITVGNAGSGTLIVADGAQFTTYGGNAGLGGSGSILVSGSGSRFTSQAAFLLANGSDSHAEITVRDGARFEAAILRLSMGGQGNLNIIGDGSLVDVGLLGVGTSASGRGILSMSEGAHLIASSLEMGHGITSDAQITVEGTGTHLQADDLTITAGSMTIREYALTTATSLFIRGVSDAPPGEEVPARLDIVDHGRLEADVVTVGTSGRGDLQLSDGGLLETRQLLLGTSQSARGEVLVSGTATAQVDELLTLGGDASQKLGQGTLVIDDGGTVQVDGDVKLWASGLIRIDHGTLRVGTFSVQDGQVQLHRGTLEVGSDFTLKEPQTLDIHRQLHVHGKLTLLDELILDGGVLTIQTLSDPALLYFVRGTLNIENNLHVGPDGLLGDAVLLDRYMTLNVQQQLHIGSQGLLVVENGVLCGGLGIINEGTLELDGSLSRVNGSTLVNRGLLLGNGRISTVISNEAAGQVRLSWGDRLVLDGDFTNYGTINFSAATLELLGGTFAHHGVMNVQGVNEVYGPVTVEETGLINVGAGASLGFYDTVVHNGVMHLTGGFVNFFGDVSGNGTFNGGVVKFFGSLNPGNSPGVMSFDSDVIFDPGHTLVMELAAGGYDHLDVAGLLSLAGRLEVVLLDGYTPSSGVAFDLLDWGELSGVFDELVLPELAGGLSWDVTSLYTTGVISVVPQPASVLPLLVGGIAMLLGRSRRSGRG